MIRPRQASSMVTAHRRMRRLQVFSSIKPSIDPSIDQRCCMLPRRSSSGVKSSKGVCFWWHCYHTAVRPWHCWPLCLDKRTPKYKISPVMCLLALIGVSVAPARAFCHPISQAIIRLLVCATTCMMFGAMNYTIREARGLL